MKLSETKNIRDLYRGINDFQKGYQPRTNVVKYEKGDFFTYCYSILTFFLKICGLNVCSFMFT